MKLAFSLLALISFVSVFFLDKIPQSDLYHNFADSRFLLFPNFMDVISNIAFLIVGIIGLHSAIKQHNTVSRPSWITFFVGVILVSFGSGYYHLSPDSNTLVWDRLPMTIAFMGLFSAIMSEQIDLKMEKYLLPFFLVGGIASVLYWDYANDLRFYYWVQFAPLILIPLSILLFKNGNKRNIFLITSLFLYIAAKFLESFDADIFKALNLMSGHTAKHIAAAISIYFVYLYMNSQKRRE